MIELDGLRPTSGAAGKLRQLTNEPLSVIDTFSSFQGIPPIGEGDRVIVFLLRPGALREWPTGASIETDGWRPANNMGDLRTSAIWIQDGVTYGFYQTMNPGPTHLEPTRVSEAELRRQIDAVLELRGAMDRAVATTGPVERSERLAALFRSGNTFARNSALQKLEHGGTAETAALLDLLADQSLLGWHQDILGVLAARRVADARFIGFLSEETAYWSATCRTLSPGWWSNIRWPDVQTPRNHYTRSYALLKAIEESNMTAALPAVKDFAAGFAACPPLDQREETNQIQDELKLVLSGGRR